MRPRFVIFLFLLALMAPDSRAAAGQGEEDADRGAWLVTYGPGEIYWQRFGHNAIWIRDPRRRIDHTFNFGFFDFEQENFLGRFIQGRMLYFSAAQPAQREFSQYLAENRSIRAQRLNLSAVDLDRLTAFLVNEVRPENRDYRYDYYFNNCSTRVRDALDDAFSGLLSSEFGHRPGRQTLREHTRRSTAMAPWLYLALQAGLGSPVDRPVSVWDELFIPAELAEAMAGLVFERDGLEQPAVLEDTWIHPGPHAPGRPPTTWMWYLAVSVAVTILAAFLARFRGPGTTRALLAIWLLLTGTAGLALLWFWLATDHSAASGNLNLLVLNPAWLVGALLLRRSPRVVGWGLAGFSAAALLWVWLPPVQYNLDVLALCLPPNIAGAAFLLRRFGDLGPT